jgi:hypothetical protein
MCSFKMLLKVQRIAVLQKEMLVCGDGGFRDAATQILAVA